MLWLFNIHVIVCNNFYANKIIKCIINDNITFFIILPKIIKKSNTTSSITLCFLLSHYEIPTEKQTDLFSWKRIFEVTLEYNKKKKNYHIHCVVCTPKYVTLYVLFSKKPKNSNILCRKNNMKLRLLHAYVCV